MEFSDFECPFCSKAEETVSQVMEKYAGKVRLVFRHFPLSFHPHAPKAAEAVACAPTTRASSGRCTSSSSPTRRRLSVEELKQHAASVGLDKAKFDECLDTGKMKALVDADTKAGGDVGVTGTPAFFINGKLISGAQPVGEFEKIIDAELKKGG